MSETKTASQEWVIKISSTGREYHFAPGESLVLGRTPLRPLPGDERRLDIDDPDKSMSKRHLLFSVKQDTSVVLHDLKSTNGSYVVDESGELMRLPLDQDYVVDRSPLHLQLGEIALELRRQAIATDATNSSSEDSARDLFADAAQVAPEGVDSPSLSVDEILDLRAGEPTNIFNARNVQQQLQGMQVPGEQVRQTSDFMRMKQDLEERNRLQREFLEKMVKKSDKPETSLPEDNQQAAHENVEFVEADQSNNLNAANEPSASVESNYINDSSNNDNYYDPDPEDSVETGQVAEASETVATADNGVRYTGASTEIAADENHDSPVFEPGAVFDRLTNSERQQHVPAVVVGNLNSDEAILTEDQGLQFEIAKHHELLPFLALNPHLYDDLYAWLEGIGDPGINAALGNNTGYAAYREGRE